MRWDSQFWPHFLSYKHQTWWGQYRWTDTWYTSLIFWSDNFLPHLYFFLTRVPPYEKRSQNFQLHPKKSLFNKKGVFLHLNLEFNFQNWKKFMVGVFWPENYSSSYFRQVSDTCIFYKSGVKNNRTKKSS